MLKLLILIGVLILLVVLARRAVLEFRGGAPRGREIADRDQMVQDPVCRVYVPRGTAVQQEIGGQMYCFCSRDCARAFEKQLAG